MSIGAPAFSPLPAFTGTAPDGYFEVICFGAQRMVMQVSNQAIFILFGHGQRGAVFYEPTPEQYLPVVGAINRPFDAFKIRAAIPLAQIPAGSSQAVVSLVPR